MRYTITGRNIDVTPGLRAAIEEKIGKLERYFLPDTEHLCNHIPRWSLNSSV